MPRFFFHTSDGDVAITDDEGLDLRDAEAAREAALDALPDMARQKLPDGDHRKFEVVVEDETGKRIYEASLELNGRWRAR